MFWVYFFLVCIVLLNIGAIYSIVKFKKEMRTNRGDIHKISDSLYVTSKLGKALLILETVGGGLVYILGYIAVAGM